MRSRTAFGVVELILGVLLVALGIYTVANPGLILGSIVVIYGIAAILSGVADIFLYVRMDRSFGYGPVFSLAGGVINIFLGILLLLNNRVAQYALVMIFPIWFIVHCIVRLTNLPYLRTFGRSWSYGWSMAFCIIGLILGFVLLFNPWYSRMFMGYILAFGLIALGVMSVTTGVGRLSSPR